MRVLQVVHSPQRRGAEVFAYELSRALRALGHAASTCYLEDTTAAVRLPLLPDDRVLAKRPAAGFLRCALALRQRVLEFEPDVVQVNGSDTVKVGALVASLTRRRPWALVRRAIGDPAAWLKDRPRRWLYRYGVMPQVDGVIAVSSTTLNGLRREGLRAPATVIPRAVDPVALTLSADRQALRTRHGVAADEVLVVSVGSLSREKRVDRLLRVVSTAAQRVPTLTCWIVGDGPLRVSLEDSCGPLGLRGRVRFWGAQDNVADFLGAADVLLLTSDTEGTPGVVLEAGCLGLPSVATRVGGTAECVQHGETGLLADPGDEAGLAHALVVIGKDPALRTRLGRAARHLVLSRFHLQQVSLRILSFYEQVLADRGEACRRLA